MKKILLMAAVAMMTAMSAQAQEKGDFAIGLRGGATLTKVMIQDWEVDETSSRFGIGAFGQYNFANHWRVELEGIYHPMKDHASDVTACINLHYLINLTKDHTLKLYPILGYGLSFVHNETFTDGGTTIHGDNSTDGGIQIGIGNQCDLTFAKGWFVSGEYKYQPGILGDGHVAMIGIGYRF